MNVIITISRQYGSGGWKIGKLLAQRFGIPFYDKNVSELAAIQSGLSPQFVAEMEDSIPGSLGYKFYLLMQPCPVNDTIFFAQSGVIREAAGKGACIIVGRCAGYVLRDHPRLVHIFIHAPKETRVARIMARANCTHEEAEEHIRLVDRKRAAYHKHYTHEDWGVAANYRFTLDSSIGIEKSVELIAALIGHLDAACNDGQSEKVV